MAATITPLLDMDRDTGLPLQGWDRCRQSIEVILTTRLRTRVMRLWWGSSALDMMDKPLTRITFARGIVAAIAAIDGTEPEFFVSSVAMAPAADGACLVTVVGTYLPDETARKVQLTL